jgi:hypothetical protein
MPALSRSYATAQAAKVCHRCAETYYRACGSMVAGVRPLVTVECPGSAWIVRCRTLIGFRATMRLLVEAGNERADAMPHQGRQEPVQRQSRSGGRLSGRVLIARPGHRSGRRAVRSWPDQEAAGASARAGAMLPRDRGRSGLWCLSSPAETGRCIGRSPVFGAARTGDGRTIEDQG